MQFSFFSSTSYMGPSPGLAVWPMPPRFCEREVAAISIQCGVEVCRRAEALGFDWVSVSEHHYAPLTLTPNPVVMAAAISQVVTRAKIAVLGPLMPISNPVRVAEDIALLDHLTGGRVIVLFLQGTPNEHRTYHAPPEDPRGKTQEGIELVLKAWTVDEPFAWHGKNFDFPNVAVWPRPLQFPHPQIFGSGNSEESARFAARRHLGMALSFLPLPAVRQRIALYREEAATAGWHPDASHIIYRGLGHLAQTDAIAEQEVVEAIEARVGIALTLLAEFRDPAAPPLPVIERAPLFHPVFLGSPQTVRNTARGFHEAGVGTLDIAFHWGVTSYEQQLRSMTLFAEHVMPDGHTW
jgi:alkanesulfonate monooxygenase SsuD/methylene tetrahydromethanopterin reductase-like flavin-dependent oxidoreductase (luciferase family)